MTTTALPLIKAPAAALLLDMHPDEVYRLAREGVLPSLKFGRRVRFEQDAVLAYGRTAGARVPRAKLAQVVTPAVATAKAHRASTRTARASFAVLDPYSHLLQRPA